MDKSYRPAYNLVRDMVAEHGGTMDFIQKGEGTGGSWLIRVGEKHTYFPWRNFSFPGLDELHVPLKHPAKTYFDYKNELISDSWEMLLANLEYEIFPPSGDTDDVFDDLID